ncbi:MAG: cobalamin-dependent protein [Phycisphaerae bacterium]|nr:cobalamin-dependent protein [Phycisphaerae bacterium]
MISIADAINVDMETCCPSQPTNPLGSKAKVLLCSVFGPYAQDDEYGSRVMNPMELYHNQVTRTQGPFSLRMFHRSWGLMLIQSNIQAPCTLLDFPVLDRFIQEIRDNNYDVVGISSIVPNVLKVRKMCELVRQYLPDAKIVVGGHIANMPDLSDRIDADFIARGEGVRWFRRYLGEDENQPIRHPMILSGMGTRNMGITVKEVVGDVAATLIPSVGCPLGCNFCSTSAMFGGKGKFINFYETGDELFDMMCQLEEAMGVKSFFVMDENFLLHRKRALRLLELMELHDKAWALYVFSSANVLCSYTIEQLVSMGISWVWMGLEGQESQYTKLHGTDPHALIRELQSHGIRVLGSSIIGMEDHTPDNIDEAIDYAVRYDTDFHQFMLYTPIPGTPLHAEMSEQGRMKGPDEYEEADIHGQLMFNYRHSHITEGQEGEYMSRAFDRDFEVNGPSVMRIVRTTLAGWKRHKNHPDPRVRRRYAWEARELATSFAAVTAATKRYYRKNPALRAKMSAILKDLYREFGFKARIYAALGGRYVLWNIRKEAKRLAAGWTYEPSTYYEKNYETRDGEDKTTSKPCRFITPSVQNPMKLVPAKEHELVAVE